MALTLKGCMIEGCESIAYVDRTGNYNPESQPGGYGPENEIESPSDFATYTLKLWSPAQDYYGTPPTQLVTIDLLLDVPTPDSDGYYTWTFYPEDLGVTTIEDGTWYWEVVATQPAVQPGEWQANAAPLLLAQLRASFDQKLAKKGCGGGCGCKDMCKNLNVLYAQFLVLEQGGVCNPAEAKKNIEYLKTQITSCC